MDQPDWLADTVRDITTDDEGITRVRFARTAAAWAFERWLRANVPGLWLLQYNYSVYTNATPEQLLQYFKEWL